MLRQEWVGIERMGEVFLLTFLFIGPCPMSREISQTSSLLYLPVGYNLACWPPSLPIRLISQLSRSILSPRLWLGGFFAEKHIHPPSSSMRLALCPPW